MPWWVMLFANGTVLYFGAFAVCAGMFVHFLPRKRVASISGNVAMTLGAVGAGVSAAPLPGWFYGAWCFSWFVAAAAANRPGMAKRWKGMAAGVVTVFGVAACGNEAWHARAPRLEIPQEARSIYVVGDSLSAVANEQERNWPELLGEYLRLPVRNHSFCGAKAGTSLGNAQRIGPEPSLIFIELGGNDIFAGTPSEQYERDLRALLDAARGPGRTLYMFELPLPPSFNAYGRIQRALAKEYAAVLFPKRILGGVFSVPGATVDGLHFSPAGHAALAERLARLFAAR